MKTFSLIGLIVLGLGAAYPAFARTGEVQVSISSVVIPSGYDQSEPVAIVSGVYPNSCYSWNRATVTHVTPKMHEIRALADVRMGMCLMVLVPFSEEVEIGKLQQGEHVLRFLNGDGTYQDKNIEVLK